MGVDVRALCDLLVSRVEHERKIASLELDGKRIRERQALIEHRLRLLISQVDAISLGNLSDVPNHDAKAGLSQRQEQQRSEYIAHLESVVDKLHGEVQRARGVANAGMSAIAPGSFMWAVEQMREGKTVRRPGRNVISPDKDGEFSASFAGIRGNLPFRMEDFYATDWEVVTDGTRVARDWE